MGVVRARTFPPSGAVVEYDIRAAEARRGGVRLMSLFAPLRAMRCEQLRQCDDGVTRYAHACGVVLPRVRLDQQGEAVALRKVPCGEAWRIHREQKARGRIVGPGEV